MTLCLFSGNKLTTLNAGDSRAVKAAIKIENGKTTCIASPLTVDHKPELPAERDRILKMGGRIKAF